MSLDNLLISDFKDIQLPSDIKDPDSTNDRIIDSNFLDENKDWKVAREQVDNDINNIAAWDLLINKTEALITKYPSSSTVVKNIISSTFNELLSRFPLFFGYWKKYISITYQINGADESIKVLSQSLDYFPNSLELWNDFLTIFASNAENERSNIRTYFQKAASLIGYQFLSHPFWDKYLEFETNEKADNELLKVVLKLIRIPLHQYAKYYQQFLTIKAHTDIQTLIDVEGIQIPEKQENKEDYVNKYFEQVFAQTQTFVAEVWPFESQIKQSFFNLAPLPAEDITTWGSYLDFLIAKHSADPSKLNKSITISTFERCLVPTALSPTFWYKYLDWYLKEFPEDFDHLNSIYKRAVDLFIPIKFVDIRLNYALFLQVHNQNVDQIHDTYLSIIRQGPLETKPIMGYIKFISRTNNGNHAQTTAFLELILSKYFNREVKAELDFHGKRLIKLLNDKTIAVIIAELVKINWYYTKNHLNVKKTLNFYSKFEQLNDSVIFWTLTYSYHKENREFTVLNRVVNFIRLESSLPLATINTILTDYTEFLAQNFPDQESITSNYKKILGLEYDIANPFACRAESDHVLLKRWIKESGHPGVLIDKPEITNITIDELARSDAPELLPTFKNVEKAGLPIEYTKEE